MPRFHAATHPFPQNSLYREQEAAFFLRFRAATHPFKRKNLYRDSWIQEKQWHNAATHPFLRNSLYREKEIVPAPKTNTPKLPGAPQKVSARIENDCCRHFSSDKRENGLFHHGQFGEVVVVLSLGDQFGREAGLLRVECKGVEVDI